MPRLAVSAVALLDAVRFASHKHRDQRRKSPDASPYINHPIEVAHLLATVGGIADVKVLMAALLHDTLEDTQTTRPELEERFGADVRALVEEVSDDKRLPREVRKELQVQHAPRLSPGAKLVKLGDKIANLRDVAENPPKGWSLERRLEYVEWTARVVDGCRGVNEGLERFYDEILAQARRSLSAPE